MAAAIPESKAVPLMPIQELFSTLNILASQAFDQFAFQTSAFAARVKPNIINPKSDKILMMVKKVCKDFPFFTPRVFTNVSNTIVAIETNCAALN